MKFVPGCDCRETGDGGVAEVHAHRRGRDGQTKVLARAHDLQREEMKLAFFIELEIKFTHKTHCLQDIACLSMDD